MFCGKCGTELGDKALFCSKCGTKVEIIPENKGVEFYKKQIQVLKTLCILFLILFLAAGACLLLNKDYTVQANNITSKNYNSIKVGMTYKEVVKILGAPNFGTVILPSGTITAMWANSDHSEVIDLIFDNNKVTSKDESALKN